MLQTILYHPQILKDCSKQKQNYNVIFLKILISKPFSDQRHIGSWEFSKF